MRPAWYQRLVAYMATADEDTLRRMTPTQDDILRVLTEHRAQELLLEQCEPAVRALLGLYGDRAPQDLIDLQHRLAALLHPPAASTHAAQNQG